MTETLQLLHCTKKSEYLQSTLKNGFMFTAHKVQFQFTENKEEIGKLHQEIIPLIDSRLKDLDYKEPLLGENTISMLSHIFAPISGTIPMLCFTEICKGKNIKSHGNNFGQ